MRRVLLCASMLFVFSGAAEAQVIWDYGPSTGTTGLCYANQTSGQNLADDVVFGTSMVVNGMDIWTCISPTAGTVHIKILLDDGAGNPGAVFTEWDQTPTSWVADGPGFMVSADFPDVNLDAGQVYWIGMSGNGFELGQFGVLNPGDGSMAVFAGSAFSFHGTGGGDQMFQVRGAPLVLGNIPTLGEVGIVVMILLLVSCGVIFARRMT
jgi:hypothetical protein